MIRHHAFFETLGDLEEKSQEWNSVFAGLSVLRLVDRFIIDEERPIRPSPELDTSRASVQAVDTGNPARAILSRIIDVVEHHTGINEELGKDLVSYGRVLDLRARWNLAVDVFQTIIRSFSPREHARIIIEAATALGAAARNIGDWDTSDSAYTQAEHLSERIGDRALRLKANVGMAGSHMVRGNLPAAEAELDEVRAEAHEYNLQDVEAIALHASASVAHSKSDYTQAIHLAYRSLELTTHGSARDRLLADIGAAYAGLGMRDAARDAYTIVVLTSPHQWVRWQASLNLIELAITEGDRVSYERQLQTLDGATFDPKLRAYFLYFQALGAQRFGLGDPEQKFSEAQAFAEVHRLNQLAFEIESARKTIPVAAIPSAEPSDELLRIAEALEHLRHEASA
jgi:tetratricopeptide (TPR) repeat protein